MSEVFAAVAKAAFAVLAGAARETFFQILFLAMPFVLAGLALHALERVAQGRLAARFGWISILLTGWIGTPVHELSHALFCLIFAHRITEMALFKPDRETGTMGYVKHEWNPSNPWAVTGNFFIGVAPLAGGAGVLSLLIWIFFPSAASAAFSPGDLMQAVAAADFSGAAGKLFVMVTGVLETVFAVDNLSDFRWWIFMYAVLCVGSHLGPSPADYKHAWKGLPAVLIALFAVNVAILGVGVSPGSVMNAAAAALGPVMALFVIALVLNSAVAAAVAVGVGILDLFKGSGR